MENNNEKSYQLVISLRQETPMIHFQYDEAGAILRGSELKPKLDKFILKKHNDNVPDEWKQRESSKGCKQEGSSDDKPRVALRYKVKIEVPDEKPIVSGRDGKKINAMYFGNMGDGDKKETVYYENPLTLTITCFIPELIKKIEECIEEFFLTTNFGTRQSKGFGGFSVIDGCEEESEDGGSNEEINFDGLSKLNSFNMRKKSGKTETQPKVVEKKAEKTAIDKLTEAGYDFFYCKCNTLNYEKQLEVAEGIYAVMKGGINRKDKDAYVKGYIQRKYLDDIVKKRSEDTKEDNDNKKEYCDNDRSYYGNDKSYMKDTIREVNDFSKKQEHYKEREYEYEGGYCYPRALLGLAEGVSFGKGGNAINVKIKSLDGEIERYQSPILIKIVGNYIIFIVQDTHAEIENKQFSFTLDKESKTDETPEGIPVPKFYIDLFIKNFVDYYNNGEVDGKKVRAEASKVYKELKQAGKLIIKGEEAAK